MVLSPKQPLVQALRQHEYQTAAELIEELLTHPATTLNGWDHSMLKALYQLCRLSAQYQVDLTRYESVLRDTAVQAAEAEQSIQDLLTTLYEGGPEAPTTEPEPLSTPSATDTLWQQIRTRITPHLPKTRPVQIPDSATVDNNTPLLSIYCFGHFRVYQADQLITDWQGQKGQMILKYLLTHADRPVSKEVLMDAFWPEMSFKAARRNLHQAVYSLRQSLRTEDEQFQHVLFEDDHYRLNSELTVWQDHLAFESHIHQGYRLEKNGRLDQAIAEYSIAEGIYEGDFLAQDLFQPIYEPLRQKYRQLYFDIANRLSKHYLAQQQYTTVVMLCRKMLAQDNCFEPAHRQLMECYLAQHQRHLAIRQYQHCEEALKSELDVAPSAETRRLYLMLLQA